MITDNLFLLYIYNHNTVVGCNIISVFKNLWNSWHDKYMAKQNVSFYNSYTIWLFVSSSVITFLSIDIGHGKFLYTFQKYAYCGGTGIMSEISSIIFNKLRTSVLATTSSMKEVVKHFNTPTFYQLIYTFNKTLIVFM